MEKYKISLGNPCTYGWQNMSPSEKGRHCAQCDKTVIDFTVMTDQQVIDYLLTHKNVCGHFNKSQLGRTMFLYSPKRKNSFHWPSIAAMLVAGIFQLMPMKAEAKTPITTIQTATMGSTPKIETENRNKYIDKDSLINIKIKVVDGKSKKAIANAHINFANIGDFITDRKGYFLFTAYYKDLPETLKVIGYAETYHQLNMEVKVDDFIKNPFFQLEMWYNDPNLQVDGGEIYIEKQ